ncbi:MAG: NAD(P)-dependent oxidoreductase [Roseburia sp.]|nr:NAD(P)-dependent oxidoreductase [Roseburia sp.]
MEHVILISDYPEELKRDLEWEKKKLRESLGEKYKVEVYSYRNQKEFMEKLREAEVLLTAFLPVTAEVLASAEKLKLIVVNATGYGTIDLKKANEKNIAVCPIREYCTQEVAEHTMALMLCLQRGIRAYEHAIEQKKSWNYLDVTGLRRIEGQTLAIFGFGRIGQAVAKRAQAFGMKILAVDPYLPKEVAQAAGVSLVEKEEALQQADVITNHMNQTTENGHYFSRKEFARMEKHPVFINAGRGSCVDETALAEALESEQVRAAGLDVLETENPDIGHHPLAHRENVVLTPHAAFYSDTSMRELQRISCENLIHFCKKEYDKVNWIANEKEIHL